MLAGIPRKMVRVIVSPSIMRTLPRNLFATLQSRSWHLQPGMNRILGPVLPDRFQMDLSKKFHLYRMSVRLQRQCWAESGPRSQSPERHRHHQARPRPIDSLRGVVPVITDVHVQSNDYRTETVSRQAKLPAGTFQW